MVIAAYNCTQLELYSVARLAWLSCGQHIVVFGNLKAKYTPALVTAEIAQIAAAKAMPDDQARNEVSETLRDKLLQKNKEALDVWQRLKRYIDDAYPESLQKSKLEGAGSKKYDAASDNDWESTEGLLESGSNFIANYSADLEADDNMPVTFAAVFNTIKDDFLTLHLKFLDSRETSEMGTEAKVKANNIIYKNLMTMLLDGQYLFSGSPATKKQFVFSDLIFKAAGAGTAGIKGTVTDALTLLPIKDVNINILLTVKIAKTDVDGKYEINQVAHGKYDIEASKAGYQTRVISQFDILVGTVSTLNIELTPDAP